MTISGRMIVLVSLLLLAVPAVAQETIGTAPDADGAWYHRIRLGGGAGYTAWDLENACLTSTPTMRARPCDVDESGVGIHAFVEMRLTDWVGFGVTVRDLPEVSLAQEVTFPDSPGAVGTLAGFFDPWVIAPYVEGSWRVHPRVEIGAIVGAAYASEESGGSFRIRQAGRTVFENALREKGSEWRLMPQGFFQVEVTDAVAARLGYVHLGLEADTDADEERVEAAMDQWSFSVVYAP